MLIGMLDVFDATIVCAGSTFSSRAIQLALRRELFYDRFDDEVALREAFEVVLGVADRRSARRGPRP